MFDDRISLVNRTMRWLQLTRNRQRQGRVGMTWALPWGGERKPRLTTHPPLPIWPFRRIGKSLNCMKRLVFPTRRDLWNHQLLPPEKSALQTPSLYRSACGLQRRGLEARSSRVVVPLRRYEGFSIPRPGRVDLFRGNSLNARQMHVKVWQDFVRCFLELAIRTVF